MWINVHTVYGVGIRTHDLQKMSRLTLPLDHGFRPSKTAFKRKCQFYIERNERGMGAKAKVGLSGDADCTLKVNKW